MLRIIRTAGVAAALALAAPTGPVAPQPPPPPVCVPTPFGDPGTHTATAYVPPGYTPHTFFAEAVGSDPECWSWLGVTPAGRPAWLAGRLAPTGVMTVVAAYEAGPGRWRFWFGTLPVADPRRAPAHADALVGRLSAHLAAR